MRRLVAAAAWMALSATGVWAQGERGDPKE